MTDVDANHLLQRGDGFLLGSEPAARPSALHDALTGATTAQAELMIRDRVPFLNPIEAGPQIVVITAARPAHAWGEALHLVPEEQSRHLVARVNAWTTTSVAAAEKAREQTRAMRRRLDQTPAGRWQRWTDLTGLSGGVV